MHGQEENFRQFLIVSKKLCNLRPALFLFVRNSASGGSHSLTGGWKLLKVKNFNSVFVLWLLWRTQVETVQIIRWKSGFDLEWLTLMNFYFVRSRLTVKQSGQNGTWADWVWRHPLNLLMVSLCELLIMNRYFIIQRNFPPPIPVELRAIQKIIILMKSPKWHLTANDSFLGQHIMGHAMLTNCLYQCRGRVVQSKQITQSDSQLLSFWDCSIVPNASFSSTTILRAIFFRTMESSERNWQTCFSECLESCLFWVHPETTLQGEELLLIDH